MQFEKLLELYDYRFPEKAIAQCPASPRDSAKLLIYDRKTEKVFLDVFRNLGDHLPPKAVLVLNETKVIPARIRAKKSTGGKVELLYVGEEKGNLRFMVNRKIRPGEKIFLDSRNFLTLVDQKEGIGLFEPSFPARNIFGVLEKFGETPIPPYIKHSPLKEPELKEKYQAVFARVRGSVAAPTASLHFTKRLMAKLQKSGFDLKFVILHVNLGTFAKLTPEQIKRSKLHEEFYEIDPGMAAFLNKAKNQGRPIVAVGTTVVRTLESASDAKGNLTKLSGETSLFIKEGYRFRFVDSLITNFHVPKSSLLMLVSAFAGRKQILDLYRKAIAKDFRIFSFGDGMLLK
ncbi:MAG TPA: tRNA preQ1(34) S-adenosylmethionine ribosyltransferase-isomerase QueA [Candidatus Colwellbacteria bacterium]|nr:tRNA preQ1(34) S-adenosylmethionine ribosyltransferase-isomerase QueA [Candidatus Colwellbacteria bacterium]HQA95761.1 tRNA preQ1(34) S-adenosylmethionine ribosyltransferase-isomerase QueA [Candidatus Colwellbacteria bacterium]